MAIPENRYSVIPEKQEVNYFCNFSSPPGMNPKNPEQKNQEKQNIVFLYSLTL
jgi:hypothetical protein